MSDEEKQVPGRVAAEDYRRQRQAADHGRDEFAKEIRLHFEKFRRTGRDKLINLARPYTADHGEAEEVVSELFKKVTTENLSSIDEPYGHWIISEIVAEITAVCAQGEIPVREGVVVGVSPAEGLHAYQSEVPATDASIIDFAVPFVIFCSEVASLVARTLPHAQNEAGYSVLLEPSRVRDGLATDEMLFKAWSLLLTRYAIEGWPLGLTRLPIDHERMATKLQILFAMELFAVAHEYGHHVLLHGVSQSSSPTADATKMEHDADGFARLISIVIGSNREPFNPYAMSGGGAVLMLGALDLVRRTTHVLQSGNTDFPPRKVHPSLHERIAHVGSFDDFVPEEIRGQLSTIRADLLGVVEAIWSAIEPMLLRMHHEGGVKLESHRSTHVDWLSLI